ncbi:hypothetical protein CspHIS471_0104580 [Cutaneotrichosporon sp. HIS471]|nr:hypothetical protein CspHIS471_0104580 [Cutaneotrichosporon sp. HIS471]
MFRALRPLTYARVPRQVVRARFNSSSSSKSETSHATNLFMVVAADPPKADVTEIDEVAVSESNDDIAHKVSDAIDAAKATASDAAHKAQDAASDAAHKAQDAASDMVDAAKSTVASATSQIKDAAEEVKDAATDAKAAALEKIRKAAEPLAGLPGADTIIAELMAEAEKAIHGHNSNK